MEKLPQKSVELVVKKRTTRTKKRCSNVNRRRKSFIKKVYQSFQFYCHTFVVNCRQIYSTIIESFSNAFKYCFPQLWRKINGLEPLRDGSFEDYSESTRKAILPKDILGREGERLVFNYIKETPDYEIVACNAENYYCELDLIYIDKPRRQIVFVEVKTRRHDYIKYPAFRAVDAKRRKKMALAAELFIKERGYFQYSKRFDVAVVERPLNAKPTIKYYRNAFSFKYALLGYKKDDFGKNRRKTVNIQADK